MIRAFRVLHDRVSERLPHIHGRKLDTGVLFLAVAVGTAGYPASPAQIPACDFPAQGSSNILTRVVRQVFTQAPDSPSGASAERVLETQNAPVPVSTSPTSDFAFDSVDLTTCTATSPPPCRTSTGPGCYPQHGSSCNVTVYFPFQGLEQARQAFMPIDFEPLLACPHAAAQFLLRRPSPSVAIPLVSPCCRLPSKTRNPER